MMGADIFTMNGHRDECAALVDKCKHEVRYVATSRVSISLM